MYDAAKHQQLLIARSAIIEIKNRISGTHELILGASARADAATWKHARQAYIDSVEDIIRAAGFDWEVWKPLVSKNATEIKNAYLSLGRVSSRGGRNGKPSANKQALRALYSKEWGAVENALKAIPPSIEKARGAIISELEQCDPAGEYEIFPEWVLLADGERPRNLGPLKGRLRADLIAGHAYTGPRYWEEEWALAQIRYAERNVLKDSKSFLESEVDRVEEELRLAVDAAYAPANYSAAKCDLRPLLHRSWLAMSSFKMRARIEMMVREALRIALTWQSMDGSWPSVFEEGKPCIATTAFATACLSMLNDHSHWRENRERGLNWLLSHRTEQGAWGPVKEMGATNEINLIVTVAILDACRMEGIPLDHPAVIEAEAALLSAQSPAGLWEDYRGMGEEYLTALIVEYFQRREQRQVDMSEATILGRGLILRGHALSMNDSVSDQVLALASIYHGLEYVLYGFLLKNDVEIRTQKGETIGFREALSAFEVLARNSNWIGHAASLPFRTQLAEMAAKRDEVIHRMGRVEAGQLSIFVERVFAFVGKFDVNALGYSLLV
ncbi:hypothetical protein GTP41_20760 [Pseudoduganella sp. DS3]|uniref:Squalene cyclase C-terminal domain-containing protein n=1 Tax=Pseudoduganella guangdongensis TaxID=2692179 RepID=A0A6N9HML8_9BURK|nr:prenyltransferase/squalene oxidase repeat-containing protein [Pseudoduganella guangdongensis]MYN04527.1 hypothetical protein [Pseudoduganella guangdongensis]